MPNDGGAAEHARQDFVKDRGRRGILRKADQLPGIPLTGAKKSSFQLAGFALIVPTRAMNSA